MLSKSWREADSLPYESTLFMAFVWGGVLDVGVYNGFVGCDAYIAPRNDVGIVPYDYLSNAY